MGVVSTTNFLRDLLSRRYLLSLHSVSYHAVHPMARHGIPNWLHVKERMCDIANSGVDQLVDYNASQVYACSAVSLAKITREVVIGCEAGSRAVPMYE